MVTLLYYCINYDPYCVALYHCFITLMFIGQIPDAWKKAVFTPVYNKGSTSDPANYRPISQSSIFASYWREWLPQYSATIFVERITSHQHGFIAKRSTTTNLLDSFNDWTLSVENKRIETIVHVDFARAFDTVSHEKLQLKLQACGITGQLLLLISNFWHDRSQVTKVGRHISQRISLTSGVVQGSCLGPLLFLICINDLVSVFNTT